MSHNCLDRDVRNSLDSTPATALTLVNGIGFTTCLEATLPSGMSPVGTSEPGQCSRLTQPDGLFRLLGVARDPRSELRSVSVFSHLNAEKAPFYRAVLRVFVEAKASFVL